MDLLIKKLYIEIKMDKEFIESMVAQIDGVLKHLSKRFREVYLSGIHY